MDNNRGFSREQNLSKETYFNDDYFDIYQLFSLSEQIKLLHKYAKLENSSKILEVGKGNGFVSDFFKKAGFDITTFDINENLSPDIVGNILELHTLIEKKADIVLCSEVLEHMEFNLFEKSLKELSLASNNYVIITLPEFKKFFGCNLQIRIPKVKVFSIPLFLGLRSNKVLASGHFWEIDYDENSTRKNIEASIQKYFTIVENGRFHTSPYHNCYVLKVI